MRVIHTALVLALLVSSCSTSSDARCADAGACPCADARLVDSSPARDATADGPAIDTATRDSVEPNTDVPRLGDRNEAGQRLVFSDEFEADALDLNSWSVFEGEGLSVGREAYVTKRSENVRVSNGRLVLTARAESMGSLQYTSGAVGSENKRYFMYGRVEARIKLPTGTGCWPAFWMMPQFNLYGPTPPHGWGWPGNGEIDIVEAVSQEPQTVHAAIHYVEGDEHQQQGGKTEHHETLDKAFHVYAIEWSETTIRWFFDGSEYFSVDVSNAWDGRRPFRQPFFLLLNLALGAPWAESPEAVAYPQQMEIDWVRVWQR